jgi:hypothetical protein
MAQTAPHWAPDAIPTEMGWVDAKTGELLMAVSGLDTGQANQTDDSEAE